MPMRCADLRSTVGRRFFSVIGLEVVSVDRSWSPVS
jgi:hypothetical protein